MSGNQVGTLRLPFLCRCVAVALQHSQCLPALGGSILRCSSAQFGSDSIYSTENFFLSSFLLITLQKEPGHQHEHISGRMSSVDDICLAGRRASGH